MNDYFLAKANQSGGGQEDLDCLNIPKDLLQIFKTAARKLDIPQIALVGGVVRDQLFFDIFQESLPAPKDIDIVIQGSAYEFAKTVQTEIGEDRAYILRENKCYKTVEMRIDEMSIDIATARNEYYSSPAENPEITTTDIKEDLQRRDFTVNAIAFDLINSKFIDPHKGRHAIHKRQLEFIHSNSVSEDPTRIIRGARYAAKLNFHLTANSLNQIKSTIKKWPWCWQVKDNSIKAPPALGIRLRMELELLLQQESWENALHHLQEWGALSILDKELQADKEWSRRLHWALKLKINPLTALLSGLSDAPSVAERIQLPMQQQNVLSESLNLGTLLSDIHSSKKDLNWKPSDWCILLEKGNWHIDTIKILICLKVPLWKKLIRWCKRWQFIKSPLSAKELIERGWAPGPGIRKEMNRLRNQQLDQFH
tara:strand:+ start:1412 stop:2686 length:1275 start_codon:yes stop_codon:yes gene_type:complete